MWKTLTVLSILLAGGAAAVRYLNTEDAKLEVTLKERSETNLVATKDHLGEVIKSRQAAEDKRDETFMAADEEEAKVSTAQTEEASKRTEKTRVQGELDRKSGELADLREQIKEIGDIPALATKAQELEIQSSSTQQQLLVARERFKSLVATRGATEERIGSLKDTEAMRQSGKMTAINARISQAFGTWGFVVISAGGRQGVSAGTALDVKRGGDVIGKLRVTNLEPNLSACDIVSVVEGITLGVGDRVVVADESKWTPGESLVAPAAADPAAPGVAPAAPGAPAAPADAGDPFGLDPAPAAPAPAPAAPAADEDPFGLGAGGGAAPATPAPAAPGEDPFGLN